MICNSPQFIVNRSLNYRHINNLKKCYPKCTETVTAYLNMDNRMFNVCYAKCRTVRAWPALADADANANAQKTMA